MMARRKRAQAALRVGMGRGWDVVVVELGLRLFLWNSIFYSTSSSELFSTAEVVVRRYSAAKSLWEKMSRTEEHMSSAELLTQLETSVSFTSL